MKTIYHNPTMFRLVTSAILMLALLMPSAAYAFITPTDLPFNITNMLPGGTASGSFTIENISDAPLTAAIQIINTSGDFAAFADQITYTVGGDFAASGNLGDLTTQLPLTSVNAGATASYTLSITLKSDGDQGTLSGKTLGFDLCIGFVGGEVLCGSDFPSINNNGGGGGGGGGGGSTANKSAPTPRIAGAATDTCEQHFFTTIRPDRPNDVAEVIKLQNFLRDLEGHHDLVVTGVYDDATQAAVKEFQEKYREEVLRPWGLPLPTMIVYITTRKMMNEIYCDFTLEFPLTADQQAEIAWYHSQGLAYRQPAAPSSTVGGIVSGITSLVGTVAEASEEVASSVSEQAAAVAEAGTSFWSKIGNFFKSIFSW